MSPDKTQATPAAPGRPVPAPKPSGGIKVTSKQLRLILLGLLGLMVIIFLATASIGLGKLSHKSQEMVDVKLKSKLADAQLTSLELAKKQVVKYAYFNDVAETVLPADKNQAQAVLDIFRLADQSGIAIASISFPASTLGGGPALATSSVSTADAISQAKPVEGIKGLYSLELTIAPQIGPGVPVAKTATYSKLLGFLKRIEHNRRTAQITQVSVQPQGNTSGPTQVVNFTLSINIFMRPTK